MEWLNEHEKAFTDELKAVRAGAHRHCNTRLTSREKYASVPRLEVKRDAGPIKPQKWVALLESGFYTLLFGKEKKRYFYLVSKAMLQRWAMEIVFFEHSRRFFLDTSIDLHSRLKPLRLVLGAKLWAEPTCQVFRTFVEASEWVQDGILLKPIQVLPCSHKTPGLDPKCLGVNDCNSDGNSDIFACTSASDAESMISVVSTLAEEVGDDDVENDVDDTCSRASSGGSGDEALDMAAVESDGGGAAEPGCRLPRNFHTVDHATWFSPYFTLTDNRSFRDLRMQVRTRYATPLLLGTSRLQRGLVTHQFGDERSNPVRTMVVLRAWALQRLTQNGFTQAKPSRQMSYQLEFDSLVLAALDCNILGSKAAVDAIAAVLPALLESCRTGSASSSGAR
jgi:hypothetical protein